MAISQGRLAYVPQQAWIRNTTLRDNITFGDLSDHSFYENVLEACALNTDLETLSKGDQTLIGEKVKYRLKISLTKRNIP